ncbi:MAG: GIY-YIG nuclease family protein [Patescibacteria group bacterium]
MFYVYVIKSRKDNKLYIGYSSDLKKRLESHNKGGVKSTKSRVNFDLIYYEAYASMSDAKTREKQIKRFSGSYNHLKKRISNSLILFK